MELATVKLGGIHLSNKNQARTAEIFDEVASIYDQHTSVHTEVANRLIERLDFIPFEAKVILDAGCGTGYSMKKIAEHYPKATLTGIDLSDEMLKLAKKQSGWFSKQKFLNQDMCHTLIEDQSVDFIYSNLALPWVTDMNACFSEWQRILKPGGLLLFSTFGPDTLQQIKSSWGSVDPKHRMMNFIDMHNIGDALLASGLAEPVMDAEHITTRHQSIKELFDELQANGNFGFLSENIKHRPDPKMIEKIEASVKDNNPTDEQLEVSWEVIYGHAWGSEKNSALQSKDDTFIIDAGLNN